MENKITDQSMTAILEKGVLQVFESERYKNYLSAMARFHQYSFANSMLIFQQRPDATLVNGYQKWKKDFGRHVRKGEKAIRILAPFSAKRRAEDGEEKKVIFFHPVSVFDISQTEGPDLPSYMDDVLNGRVDDYEVLMKALIQSACVPVELEAIAGGSHGYYDPVSKMIRVDSSMSQLQTIKTLVHEMAHASLQHGLKAGIERNVQEVEAESIAYIVCSRYNLDTSQYSFGYIAGYSSHSLSELKNSMARILACADQIISKADSVLYPVP